MKDDKKLREKILKLRNKGMSLEAIAKALKISKPKVHYQLKMAEAEALKMEYEQKLRELQKKEAELREKFRKLQEWEHKLKEREKQIVQNASRAYQEEIKKKREEVKRLESERDQLREEIIRLKLEAKKISESIVTLKKRREELKRELESLQNKREKLEKSIKLKVDVFKDGMFYYVVQFYVNIPIEEDFKYNIVSAIERLKLDEIEKVISGKHIEAKELNGYDPLLYVKVWKRVIKDERDKAEEIIKKITEKIEEKLREYKEFEDFIESLKIEKVIV